jgi:pimeloyl-ACP methyl ester carboxylesterase
MQTVSSADGTTIAYERQGTGPTLIIVDGALCARGAKAGLADLLAADFTVYRYDRRGRGDSGDTPPYAVEREIEDLLALIGAAGGTAFLYGHSSGCALVLDTVLQAGQASVPKIALYEAPYNDDPAVHAPWKTYLSDIAEALAANRGGDAVARFMAYLGTPAAQVDAMRQAPFFPALAAIGPTLAYDHAGLMGDSLAVPVAKAAHVGSEALVMYGGASFPFMSATARTLSTEMPHARLREVDGQTHDVDPAVLAPVLREFFAA